MDAVEICDAAVIGAGPAGLAAAEALLARGVVPVIFEGKPSAARKFLMAGKSGLNLTKDEPLEDFVAAYGCPPLEPHIRRFGPGEMQNWAEGLGEALFTGSSGRVFPVAMKASPLLRRWFGRLGGAELRIRWRFSGFRGGDLAFETPDGSRLVAPGVTILAMGGASWPRLGSDGAWSPWLAAEGVPVRPFRPANMGFDMPWSAHFRDRFAGAPVKDVVLSFGAERLRGEFVASGAGVEGSAIYALSARLRDAAPEARLLVLDLAPGRSLETLIRRLSEPKGSRSLANHLRRKAGIEGVKAGLLRECAADALGGPVTTAEAIKALPLRLGEPRPLAEAISSAGGVAWEALDADLMLKAMPGVFAAGEMIDWEAPTGGYLLTACLATGFHAGEAAAQWLGR